MDKPSTETTAPRDAAGPPPVKPPTRLPILEAALLAAVGGVLLWGHPSRGVNPVAMPVPAGGATGGATGGSASPAFQDSRPLLTAPPPVAVATATVSNPDSAPVAVPSTSATPSVVPPVVAAAPADIAPGAAAKSVPVARIETATARPPAAPIVAVAPVDPAAALPSTAPAYLAAIPAPRMTGIEKCTAPAPPPGVAISPLDSGRMRIGISAACHANQDVRILYENVTLVRRLSPTGGLEMTFDLFAGAKKSIDVVFADNLRRVLPTAGFDFDRVSKVAVIWKAPVNLDLHVFEYGAAGGQTGHIWNGAASSVIAARAQSTEDKRGHGFLSTSDTGRGPGDKLEVYTFVHHDAPMTGAVAMALDYESRGELPSGAMCGTGELAKVEYRIATLSRTGAVTRTNSTLRALDCEVPIPAAVRFDATALPVMRVRN